MFSNRNFYRLFVALMNFKARKQLRVRDFTIITNTCIGAVIYNKLGLPYQSPFINLDFSDIDFIKLVRNLKVYMEQKLCFVEIEGVSYPTAYLGDILIHFVHYSSRKEAEELWEERKKRIRYDKLYFIMSDRPSGSNYITESDIISLNEIDCCGKVVFTASKKTNIPYTIQLPKDPNGNYVRAYMYDKTSVLRKWRWEKYFDYVYWLNTGKVKVI